MVTTNISLKIISAFTSLHSQHKITFLDNTFSTFIITSMTITMSYLAKARYFKDSFMFIAKGLHLLLKSLTQSKLRTTKESLNDLLVSDYQIKHIFISTFCQP